MEIPRSLVRTNHADQHILVVLVVLHILAVLLALQTLPVLLLVVLHF